MIRIQGTIINKDVTCNNNIKKKNNERDYKTQILNYKTNKKKIGVLKSTK